MQRALEQTGRGLNLEKLHWIFFSFKSGYLIFIYRFYELIISKWHLRVSNVLADVPDHLVSAMI